MKKNKQHAKDYLFEYSAKDSTKRWLRSLISKAIDSNGKISEEDENEVLEEALKDQGVNSQFTQDQKTKIIEEEKEFKPRLLLKKITHEKGVNALALNHSITFSQNLTLVYGLNGVGKSGYFRIIHEIAGGSKQKKILKNVHQQDANDSDIKVDVSFSLDAGQTLKTYKWLNKSARGVAPFDQIKVFDSEYLPILLDEREVGFDLKPMGLHLFQIIVRSIENIKNKITERKRNEDLLKPDLQELIRSIKSNELRQTIAKPIFNDDDKRILLNENHFFNSEDLAKLEELKKQKQDLQDQNIKDKKKFLDQEIKGLSNLQKNINNLEKSIGSFVIKVSERIAVYSNRKKIRDEQVKSFAVLQNIEKGEEWQDFIESAKKYQKVLGDHQENNCVYCHQTLNEDAINLVQSYSKYLEDKSQKNFKDAESDLELLSKELTSLSVEIDCNILESISDENLGEFGNLFKTIKITILFAKKKKNILLKALMDKTNIEKEVSCLDILGSFEVLTKLIEHKQKILNDLHQSDEAKKIQINHIDKAINELEDRQILSSWNERLIKYFSHYEQSEKYDKINRDIGTTFTITNLGSQAHDELLTINIKQSLENELKILGDKLEITLDKSGSKGKHFTKLKIAKTNVREVLSEGEQKKVALALFLSEITYHKNTDPIVFDDPVTSLDHEISEKLAKRFVSLSMDRQVIIFTHNLLFAKQLSNEVAVKKVEYQYHTIDRSPTAIGRVNLNESPKMANVENLIKKYENSIKDYENLGSEKREEALSSAFDFLRCACECFVEELLFGGAIQRYSDRVRMQNLEEAVLDKSIAQNIVALHGKISEKGMMHNHSDDLGQPSISDFQEIKKEFKDLYNKTKEEKKRLSKERKNNGKIFFD